MRSEAAELFRQEYGAEPEWLAEAPGRANLIGEHVDYVGGLVLPCAIDRHVAVAGATAAAWEVRSETPGGERYLKAVADQLGAGPQRVAIAADLAPGSGLSSSAALLVAAAAGLRPDLDGRQAALLCQAAEQAATGVQVGVMDHFAAALGRLGFALLLDCASLELRHVSFPDELLIALIDSGIRRQLADTPYNQRRREAEAAVAAAGLPLQEIESPGDDPRLRHLVTEVRRVRDFVAALEASDFEWMGRLLDESHQSLRDDFQVSTPELDSLAERARAAPGCYGARLLGAGFGGSLLALVRWDRGDQFAEALGHPVTFCRTADGAYAGA